MVSERWKLANNHDSSYSELYDIAGEPYEQTNVTQTRADDVRHLARLLDDWKTTLPEYPTGDVFLLNGLS